MAGATYYAPLDVAPYRLPAREILIGPGVIPRGWSAVLTGCEFISSETLEALGRLPTTHILTDSGSNHFLPLR
jgi:hypothetical protein